MFLFKQLNLTRKFTTDHLIAQRDDWFDGKLLKPILKKERDRSDRTGSPLSYIVFHLSRYQKVRTRISDWEYVTFLRELISAISCITRACDFKFFSGKNKISVILVDTDLNGAKQYVEKVSGELFKHFEHLERPEFIHQIKKITFSTYPLNYMPDCEQITGTPVLVKQMNIGKSRFGSTKRSKNRQRNSSGKNGNGSGRKSISEKSGINLMQAATIYLNWETNISSDGSIGLRVPALWHDIIPHNSDLVYAFLKRCLDIAGALIGLIVLAPVMALIAILVKSTSKGPVFFRQQRYGYLGKPFTFFKFRSMRINCDAEIHLEYVKKLIEGKNDEVNNGSTSKPMYKIKKDPRITPLGHILRKTSLDEFPQLFNVLLGQMSLVGPRPPIPYEVDFYKDWHLRRILDVKPGITGIWQVNGRSKTSFDEMVRMDLQYVRNRSVFLDLKIILKTFWIVFKTDGAM